MKLVTRCDLGDRKRAANRELPGPDQYVDEDSVGAITQENVHRDVPAEAAALVLTDGAGGEDAGDAASYLATSVVLSELQPLVRRLGQRPPGAFDVDVPAGLVPDAPDDERIREALVESITTAQRRIVEYARDLSETTGREDVRVHTTVVAGVYDGRRLHYAWVGDSRAYVLNTARERLDLLTEDHTEVRELLKLGLIDETEALVHPKNNEVRQAVGGPPGTFDDDPLDIDTGTVPLFEDDVVLFASDGLTDPYPEAEALHEAYQDADDPEAVAADIREKVVTDDDILEVALDAASLSAAGDDYVSLANDHGGDDNVSVLLFQGGTVPTTPEELPARGVDAPGGRQATADDEPDTEELKRAETEIEEAEPGASEEDADDGARAETGPSTATLEHVTSGQEFEVEPDTTIGRSDADIRIERDPVDPTHARFLRREGNWYIRDEGSGNGTYVEMDTIRYLREGSDSPTAEELTLQLRDGAEIGLGAYREELTFVFRTQ